MSIPFSAQVLPSTLFFSAAESVNGSSADGQCSNVSRNLCTDPISSILSDGNVPELTGLDGDMWASELLTLVPRGLRFQLPASVIADFSGIADYVGLSRVEVVLFNCPDWGIMPQEIIFRDNSVSRSFNPARTSCEQLVRTCVEQFTNDTIVILQFVFAPGSNYTHIAEITFFNDSNECPGSPFIGMLATVLHLVWHVLPLVREKMGYGDPMKYLWSMVWNTVNQNRGSGACLSTIKTTCGFI